MSFVLHCRGAKLPENEAIYYTDKVIIPEHFFEEFRSTILNSGQIIFKITNIRNNKSILSGLHEFGESSYAILPKYIKEQLELEEDDYCDFKPTILQKIESAIFQPLTKDFIESVGTNDAVPILEQSLSNYTTLSKNQILPIRYCNRDYMLKVVELPPSYNSVWITGCSFTIDLLESADGKQPIKLNYLKPNNLIENTLSSINEKCYYYITLNNEKPLQEILLEIVEGDADIFVSFNECHPDYNCYSQCNISTEKNKKIDINISQQNNKNSLYISIIPYKSNECKYRLIAYDITELFNYNIDDDDDTIENKDENKKYCESCGKYIPINTYEMHCLRCEKYIKQCNTCGYKGNMESITKHEEIYHKIIKCKLCDIDVECFKIPYHLEKECIFRRIQCEYCSVDIPFIEFENHEMYCSSQTVKCDYCSEYIILSNYKQHLAMKHNINPYLSSSNSMIAEELSRKNNNNNNNNNVFTCPDCKDIFESMDELNSHLSDSNYRKPKILEKYILNIENKNNNNSCSFNTVDSKEIVVKLYNEQFKRHNLSWRIMMKDILYSNDLLVDELVNHDRDKEDEIECEGCSLKVNLKYLQCHFNTCPKKLKWKYDQLKNR